MELTVQGGRVYTTTGTLQVEGWVNQPAVVTAGGTPTTSHEEPNGRTGFFADLFMDVGTSNVPIEAETADGRTAVVDVTIIHDPTLGAEFASITDIDPATGTLTADYAEWLTGGETVRAAIEDGEANADGTHDTDFYIRNRNDRLRTLPSTQRRPSWSIPATSKAPV